MKNIIIELVVMLLLFILGSILFCGRGGWFIPIYNALSKKEQDSYNKGVLFKAVGICYYVCSVAVALIIISEIFMIKWLPYLSTIIIILDVVILNVWMCMSKTLRKNEDEKYL